MADINLPAAETVVKTARTYAVDLIERIIWTFLGASTTVALAAGPADMLSASFWESVAIGGGAAVVTLVKGVLARLVGTKNSASTASGV
ncbi:hypothetical protein DMH12_04555 [Streptomyces sp. WAC 04229]|uniref:hypothetical protein n=1 Tax=Streptomyces sp. WAC 04229 TaxID=2203206 RepID=UPI000F74128A|nr:hypothetical protein [Streptomyces sp. WAC 04229]RSN64046.1 hypothetical protein DMH12_04555 [Streptomyces sp. WAC 04229]